MRWEQERWEIPIYVLAFGFLFGGMSLLFRGWAGFEFTWVFAGASEALVGVNLLLVGTMWRYARITREIVRASLGQGNPTDSRPAQWDSPLVYPQFHVICGTPGDRPFFDRLWLNVVNLGLGSAVDVRFHLRMLTRPNVRGDAMGPHILLPTQVAPQPDPKRNLYVIRLVNETTQETYQEEEPPANPGYPWRLALFMEFESLGGRRLATASFLHHGSGGWRLGGVEQLGEGFRYRSAEEWGRALLQDPSMLGREMEGPEVVSTAPVSAPLPGLAYGSEQESEARPWKIKEG